MEPCPQNYVYHWGGHFMYLGRFEDNVEHAHHALQIVFDRTGSFKLGTDGSSIECSGVIIGADRRHQLLSSSTSLVHLWIDKEAAAAKLISAQHLKDENIKVLDTSVVKRLNSCIPENGNNLGDCTKASAAYEKIVFELGCDSGHSGEPIDPRIGKAIDLVRENYLSEKLIIADIARHACLSEGRLIHLFTEQIGIPLRRYVLWMRLLTALRLAAQGEKSLTDAAHFAGFSDSAHLSRTSRRMFGIAPSGCASSHFIKVISCFACHLPVNDSP